VKIWVETRTLDAFPDCTFSGRFGQSIMFVGYDKLLKQWLWLQPNGVVERIAEPTHVWLDEEFVAAHTLPVPRPKLFAAPKLRRKNTHAQLALEL
jgi:hypothetical protein